MSSREREGPWSYTQGWDIEAFGSEIVDEAEQARWARAFSRAGGLPYTWQVLARPISEIVYSLLEVAHGDRVLLIGEGIEPCGWRPAIEKLVGPTGSVDAIEIILRGREAIDTGERGRNGAVGCWKWDYTLEMPDAAYDAVAIMQAAQHCDDWSETGRELVRVLKPGRRIVSAEALNVGPNFLSHINSDVHIRQWYEKMTSPQPNVQLDAISFYTAEDLLSILSDVVVGAHAMEWRGVELFWGRTPT